MLTKLWLYICFSDPNYERHLLDIKIVPENTTPEILKELSDEMDRMCSKYLKNKGMSNHFFDYLKRCHNVMVETLTGGCIKITVQCPTLDLCDKNEIIGN